ncbi:Lrp/AsnC family transcriptional regulator [Rhizobium sp. TH2]|uniref:Lrp/AsnC family transcriptional regulator n=1 Tax=Rhizobium sp. TH2 TaxID=2775403 RepID=UPI002158898F|nr:Lrp/AsnC family transcriptional regulator [Rhizobium sp. TH2]UVC09018.1 Lrp/AsnC family transcriptional regulator [Rhizobium sp. TH2]
MNENTDGVRRRRLERASVDASDRRILAELARDAGQSFAELGLKVALSPPAVHERVKRMKQSGVIRDTVARIDATAVGKSLLAFVHVEAAGWGKSERLLQLARYPEIEEMHSVAGDASMVLKVRTESPQALEHLLGQIHSVPGVRGTKSFIALSTFLDRPVQAEVTETWPDFPMPE